MPICEGLVKVGDPLVHRGRHEIVAALDVPAEADLKPIACRRLSATPRVSAPKIANEGPALRPEGTNRSSDGKGRSS